MIWQAYSKDGTRIVATGDALGEAVDKALATGQTDPILDIERPAGMLWIYGNSIQLDSTTTWW